MPIDKGTTLPITQLNGLQINYKDSNSCFNLPIMNNAERDALINTNDPNNPIKNGTMIFNSDDNLVQYYQIQDKVGTWISVAKGAGTGDVVGPASSTDGNIAVFNGNTGKIIKDSGVAVTRVPNTVLIDNDSPIKDNSLYELSNLKILHFGDIDLPGSIDTATIMMDGFTPITFQTQKLSPAEEIICSVFNGELGAGSSSPSAIVEINSQVGGFLYSRLTKTEIDALIDPVDGLTVFNTDSKKLNLRAGGTWIALGDGTGQGTVTSVGLTSSNLNIRISDSPITTSGNIKIDLVSSPIFTSVALIQNGGYKGWFLESSPTVTGLFTLTLPDNLGTKGQVLSTDGTGVTSWTSTTPANSFYLLTTADANLPNATVLPVINTGIYSSSVSGSGNLYIGNSSGSNGTATHDNIGLGYQTLDYLTNNSAYNIAIGPQALRKASNSQCNTVIGYQSMANLTTDSTGTYYNTAVGYQTFLNLSGPVLSSTASIQNTAIGYKAGSTYTSYKNCTFLGANTDTNQEGLQYATAIGHGTIVKQNWSYAIGSEESRWAVGIGIGAPHYTLHLNNTLNSGPSGGFQTTCSILLSNAAFEPYTPTNQYDVCLWANKGTKNGALFIKSDTGGVYKVDSTSIDEPASEPKIPVLTADEIQNLQEIALGAIVYDSTNDTVIISTKSGWQNLTLSLYNPQNISAGIKKTRKLK